MTCCAPVSAFPTALAAYRMRPTACARRRQPAGHARRLAHGDGSLPDTYDSLHTGAATCRPRKTPVARGRQLAAPGKHRSYGGGSLPPLENIVRTRAAACRPWKTAFARGRRLAAPSGDLPPLGERFLSRDVGTVLTAIGPAATLFALKSR